MSAGPIEFAFVAALEREVSDLVRGWTSTTVRIDAESFRIYRSGRAALICAGTGTARAYAAAKVLVENCSPGMIISIGFAGSCSTQLQPGAVLIPATLFDVATEKTFQCAGGRGMLVTSDRVAGMALKREWAARVGALGIDMEAAGVAAAAEECSREFAAIKVISDGVDEDLGFLASFVRPEGFETGRFIAHIALRPGLWPRVAALNRNSKLAAAALERAVNECVSDWQSFSARHLIAAQV